MVRRHLILLIATMALAAVAAACSGECNSNDGCYDIPSGPSPTPRPSPAPSPSPSPSPTPAPPPGGTTPPSGPATLITVLDGSSCSGFRDTVTVIVDGVALSGNQTAGELRSAIYPGTHVIRAESRTYNWPTTPFTVPQGQQYTYFTFYCR